MIKNTLFISDLHAGSPLFKHREYLTNIIKNDKYERIVVVGDVIDVWEKSVESILDEKYSPIEALRFSDKQVFVVRGNHDPSVEVLQEIFPKAKVVDSSVVIDGVVVVHGDEFDDLIIKYSKLARFLHYIHWVFERLGINFKAFFRTLFYSVSSKMNKKYYTELVYAITEKIIEKYGNYDKIVTGHTHMPVIMHYSRVKHPDVTYMNCGDWVHNYTYLECDKNNVFTLNEAVK